MLEHLSHPRGRDFEFRMREVPDLEIARIPNARIGGPVEAVADGGHQPALDGCWLVSHLTYQSDLAPRVDGTAVRVQLTSELSETPQLTYDHS